jgi:hypothetical protein
MFSYCSLHMYIWRPQPLPAECVDAQNTVETLVSALAGAGALIGFFVTPLLGRASGAVSNSNNSNCS